LKTARNLTILAIAVICLYCFPLRKIDIIGIFTIHSTLALYYGVIMILAMYVLRYLPLIWNFVSSLCFTLLSMDYWELPFPWLTPLKEGVLYFIIRWRLFQVITTMLVMFVLFKYKWTFWKFFALTLPGFLAITLYPLIIYLWGELWFIYLPIIGHLDCGPLRYMPNRIISTIALGWVMLKGEPSVFLKGLMRKEVN